MNTDEMVEMARERVGWYKSPRTPWVLCEARKEGDGFIGVAHPLASDDELAEQDGEFIANAPRALIALADELAALKAVAASMARAIRSAKSDAVYDPSYEWEGNEYTAYAIDSDYVHGLYRALADYERATDPAPKMELQPPQEGDHA